MAELTFGILLGESGDVGGVGGVEVQDGDEPLGDCFLHSSRGG